MEDEIVSANILSLEKAEGVQAFFLQDDGKITVVRVPYAGIVELTFNSGSTATQAEYLLGDPYGIIYPVSQHEKFLFLWIHEVAPSKEFMEVAIKEYKERLKEEGGSGRTLRLVKEKGDKGDKNE